MNSSRDRVLLSRRKHDVHMGGCWEYPGGKLEAGENPWQALTRELEEELGITVRRGRRFKMLEYDYPDRKISLSTWIITAWDGEPLGREGQAIDWFDISSLHHLTFPDANACITRLLQLSDVYLITPDRGRYDESFFQTVSLLLDNGLRLLQFRSPSSPVAAHDGVVRDLLKLCESRDCRLLYNGDPGDAMRLGAHGVHLNSKRLMAHSDRPLPTDMWVAASCHTAEELAHAAAINADFCVLSPTHQTNSHPDGMPTGWNVFSGMVKDARLPVYALGGLCASDRQRAWDAGASGIAILPVVWSAAEPQNVLKQLQG